MVRVLAMFAYNEPFQCGDAFLLYPASVPATAGIRGSFAVAAAHGCRAAFLGLLEGERVSVEMIRKQVTDLVAGSRRRFEQPPGAARTPPRAAPSAP